MASVRKQGRFQRTAEEVWESVSGFGGMGKYMAPFQGAAARVQEWGQCARSSFPTAYPAKPPNRQSRGSTQAPSRDSKSITENKYRFVKGCFRAQTTPGFFRQFS